MDVSAAASIVSAVAPESKGGSQIQQLTAVSSQPDISQPADSGATSANDPDSPQGNLLNTQA